MFGLFFLALLQDCAPTVAPQTMAAIVKVESNNNPYAIGVVGGHLVRQPASRDEAVETAKQLESDGWNFSVGVAQINRYNLPKYEISYEQAFDTCINLRVGSKILEDCYLRAFKRTPEAQTALRAAFSCYYSGNFTRGFYADMPGKQSYVEKVLASAAVKSKGIPVVPSVQTESGPKDVMDKDAGYVATVALKAQPTKPKSPLLNNAPVLLSPSETSGGTAVQLQPGVSNNANEKPASAEKSEPSGSSIVF